MNLDTIDSARYGKCLHNARKVSWDIDADVIRFRQLDTTSKFLPDSLSLVTQLPFLTEGQQRLAKAPRVLLQLGRIAHRMAFDKPLHHLGFEGFDDQQVHARAGESGRALHARCVPQSVIALFQMI